VALFVACIYLLLKYFSDDLVLAAAQPSVGFDTYIMLAYLLVFIIMATFLNAEFLYRRFFKVEYGNVKEWFEESGKILQDGHKWLQKLTVTLFLIFVVFYFTLRNGRSYLFNTTGYPKYQATILLKRDTLVTNDSTAIFCGKTKNHTFLYNKVSNETLVLSNSDIQKLFLKELRDGL
jgi:hypothetical protein